ncbi:class I SAM-dependent methyltransferase [Desulfospira joergensenii]|uniref:class I SAM-dependent methyltransferase n=1 Tax=Desulfospira joergensenii TaxID=53329 RepID=UPI0003B69938|nr:class I SAM-dependent methyltransferase [Desulfospira joergensenii]
MPGYYHKHSKAYFEKTVGLDPSGFLSPFVRCLSPGARILDVGCGSGRDLLWLKRKGFEPVGFERSPGLADLAKTHSGCPVIQGDFMSHDFSSLEFDAVLLSGAFVHLSRKELVPAFQNVLKALDPGGHVFLSMKTGQEGSSREKGRTFTLWQDKDLRPLFKKFSLEVIHFSINESLMGTGEVWLGYVLGGKG